MGIEWPLIGKEPVRISPQPFQWSVGQLLRLHISQGLFIDPVVLMTCSQELQKVDPALRLGAAKPGKKLIISLSPKALQGCFARWMQAVVEVAESEVVAIDGKTIQGSFDRAGRLGAIHRVSAWAQRNGVNLGQMKTDEKSTEITAIPALLGLLELRGCSVTLDAMGCQREIAEKIRAQGAD
jgi:hypothetical protein